jgi:hypothetical protein
VQLQRSLIEARLQIMRPLVDANAQRKRPTLDRSFGWVELDVDPGRRVV